MADYLSSAEWKKVLKDHKDLKAPGIGVQIDAFQKAEAKKDLLEQIAALNELLDEVKAAKTKNAKDKELVEYFDGITKDAKKKVGTLETQAAKQAKQEAKQEEAEQREKEDSEELPEEQAKDQELLAMVKRAMTAKRDQPLRYAILQQTRKEGALVLGKATVPADKIQAARQKAGGGRIVSRGICFNENGKLIFESPRKCPPHCRRPRGCSSSATPARKSTRFSASPAMSKTKWRKTKRPRDQRCKTPRKVLASRPMGRLKNNNRKPNSRTVRRLPPCGIERSLADAAA